ncbi:uncharacterized protein YndB with AHSA1/START domain [Crossiella equi]|uniref:Uncharacterized protein YndB with AHSA1/START domain n=1 Tax=Crossiella equi TaxID=130796 RepID=A0ABS5A7L2_9PSEU|nr:SRPBCC domain-containing protein [Crossiella equi]MBP2472583.1 uncharacterized protein YndB with AHSA1/START domain [Crossiella equi]
MTEMTGTRTIELTRLVPAPRARVYRAWTEAALFSRWFGTDPERTTLDARPGGRWRGVMVYEGQEMTFSGEFVDLAEPARVVLTLTDNPDGPHALATVELTEEGEGTRLRFTQSGELPKDGVQAATEGWEHFLAGLAEVVTATDS